MVHGRIYSGGYWLAAYQVPGTTQQNEAQNAQNEAQNAQKEAQNAQNEAQNAQEGGY